MNKIHHTVTSEGLTSKKNIGLERSKNIIKVTTQMKIRSALHPLTRRYRTDLMQQSLRRTTFYGDTFFAKTLSILNNTCGELFIDGQGFTYVYPMHAKSEVDISHGKLRHDVGIPNQMVTNSLGEHVGKFSSFTCQYNTLKILLKYIEPYSP